jgi:hypothetical protein
MLAHFGIGWEEFLGQAVRLSQPMVVWQLKPVQRARRCAVDRDEGRNSFRSLVHEVKNSGYIEIAASGYCPYHFFGR